MSSKRPNAEARKRQEAEDREREYEREYKRQQRAEAIANGYCQTCVTRKATNGYSSCPECRAAAAERAARKRERIKKKHLCGVCMKKRADKGYLSCGPCRKARALNGG